MTIFKPLSTDDRVSTKTLLHEAIPITGTIVSGTYGDNNIQNFSHGMFQSVYDYPFLSSSANHIFDISAGLSTSSTLYSSVASQKSKKNNIYNQMAQVLSGYDKNGNIQRFDEDGNLTGGDKIDNAFFLTFSRLLVKDEIKKGSFELELGVNASHTTAIFSKRVSIKDTDAATSFRVNSPAGEYGILYVSNSAGVPLNGITTSKQQACGLIFYQAGVAVINSAVFMAGTGSGAGPAAVGFLSASVSFDDALFVNSALTGSEISSSADSFRRRIYNLQFNNTIELNSTVYFCRAKHNEFNYSSNPTYLTGSQIRVKTNATDTPISYITSIGLYSADNQLLAIGKFSEPIRKDRTIELTTRARLDY
jgi:hypothetical protein